MVLPVLLMTVALAWRCDPTATVARRRGGGQLAARHWRSKCILHQRAVSNRTSLVVAKTPPHNGQEEGMN